MNVNDEFPQSWHRDTFRAMGSEMAVWLETGDPQSAATALAQVRALFERNEQALSRFRPDSELSRLNARSGEWVVISDLLWQVLSLALEMSSATGGLFDPTMLNALEQYGYTVTYEQLTFIDLSGPEDGPSYPGQWTAVKLDPSRQAVFLPAGMRIDLGGIAKGYTAQQAVDWLRDHGPCLVDAGGDLVAGSAPADFSGWPVAVSSPWSNDDRDPVDLCTMWLANEALATSGIDYRNWQIEGRLVHHLIDPASGTPALTDGLTLTILAEDAAKAEAWATAALVAGSDVGMDALLEAGLAGLMVTQDGGILVTPPMHERLQLQPA
jgi:thiamine biosynthesis lipoprotein